MISWAFSHHSHKQIFLICLLVTDLPTDRSKPTQESKEMLYSLSVNLKEEPWQCSSVSKCTNHAAPALAGDASHPIPTHEIIQIQCNARKDTHIIIIMASHSAGDIRWNCYKFPSKEYKWRAIRILIGQQERRRVEINFCLINSRHHIHHQHHCQRSSSNAVQGRGKKVNMINSKQLN